MNIINQIAWLLVHNWEDTVCSFQYITIYGNQIACLLALDIIYRKQKIEYN
jgi:hypothetical protein